MNLDARINALTVELRERGTIPCALLGRKVRPTECCSRGLAATVKEFQTCRACPEGQRLAATAPPWGFCKPLPAPVVYTPPPAGEPVRKAAPVATHASAPGEVRRKAKFASWEHLCKITGVKCMTDLAAKTDLSYSTVSRIMRAIDRGQAPQGVSCDRILRFAGITIEQLIGRPLTAEDLRFSTSKPKAPRQPKPKTPRPERPAKSVPTCRQCGWKQHKGVQWPEPDLCSACAPAAKPVRPKHLDKPVVTTAPVQIPVAQATPPVLDTRLARLASALRELTADGRMRVSMLDLMRAVGAANYDEAAGLVIHAGLRTSQLSGPVQTVLVDHNARLLMASAASEVRK